MKLCGLIPNSYIHVSVNDLYIPIISLPTLFGWSKIGRPILGIYKWIIDVWRWKLEDRALLFCFGNNKPDIYCILDSHRPFICSVCMVCITVYLLFGMVWYLQYLIGYKFNLRRYAVWSA
jgi:hypothetical protein